jgi:uncharacterized membrane protein YkvA (DUF1232 family)
MQVLANRFFRSALSKAARLTGKPGRIVSLLTQLALKIHQSGNCIRVAAVRQQFDLIGRFIKSVVLGHYKIQSPKIFVTLLAAVIYFINPLDLIPDFFLGIGLTDDLAVLSWVYHTASSELASFQDWERANAIPIPTD